MTTQNTNIASTNPVIDLIETLKSNLEGKLLFPGDAGYDKARIVWNGMIDKRPAVIAWCRNANDVIHAVNFCGY